MRATFALIWGFTLVNSLCHALENSQSNIVWRWQKRSERKDEANHPLVQLSPKFLSLRGGTKFQRKAFQSKAKSQTAEVKGRRSVAPTVQSNHTASMISSGPSIVKFWHYGVLQVHENFLHLFWQITKATTLILIPIGLLVILGHHWLPTQATAVIVLVEGALDQLRTYLNMSLLFPLLLYSKVKEIPLSFKDYNQVFRDLALPTWLAVLSRPVMDGILFRWAVKTCWDQGLRLCLNKSQANSTDYDLRWSSFSSVLYALSHSGRSLPPPSAEVLHQELERVLETGFLAFGGISIYRENWNADIVKTLLRSQPLVMAICRGVTSGILSWGLLCPLYAIHGLMASMGAQMAWCILGLAHVDTQILIRVLGRVFTPWSTPRPTPSSRVTLIMRPFLDTIILRWGIRSMQTWWVQVYGYPQEWSAQTWMVLSSVIFSISHIQTSGLPSWQRYRRKPFPTLLTLKFVGRLVLNALISWGWLCPVYEQRGMWASVGAQVFWQMLRIGLAYLPSALGSEHVSRSWSWFENRHRLDVDSAEKEA